MNGRANQKTRTRKDLLQAAARLMQEGKKPGLEEIAEAAMVSRATAYRHFSSVEALLLEAALDIVMPTPELLFAGDADGDPLERLQRADTAMHQQILANEPALRVMLANTLQQAVQQGDVDAPPRQNRRTPIIEAALAPARGQFTAARFRRLTRALALVIGTESFIVCKDVLGLSDAETRAVKTFAIKALVAAARKDTGD